jgi:hypothetical protein
MARNNNNMVMEGLSGQIGKSLVIKQYGTKTIVTKFPDMSHIKPSKPQQQQRSRFAQAVAYAKHINNDAALNKAYREKIKKGQSVYQYALQEFLKKQK